ncbi:MAG: hypothetical protein HOE45_10200 [Gammaproteobacteria bacterium]|jgi:mannose/fructose/N-acetylgalactosamine-specific phosphotransferase system component IIB|nr:hypothetical protein [Gammaproteobacteria bacterium]MBT4147224.1 hypothetical protein [Gammaproteobacteria bacterium]MBT5221274.1 hypothetical protein [Gammaproteobacteria bacterium]MBT5826773.1 hypothetical protein [Gammaproteobacteria bacterium]MBT5966779.1 hypothetical protein [Gammaproteobacteria bacterium]
MDLLKKLVMAFFVSFAMLAVAPSAMAAGKTENQTQAEVVQSLTDTVTASEEALAAMKSSADKETVMALIKKTKQTAKTIQSSVVLAQRDRALNRVAKARGAYKKGQTEKAIALMEEAVQRFKDVEAQYHNF